MRELRLAFAALLYTLASLHCESANAGRIIGFVDAVSETSVAGWACDSGVNASVGVHLYAKGTDGSYTFVRGATANLKNEPAVNAACGTTGSSHRYNIPLSLVDLSALKGKKVYVHGISLTGGANFAVTRSGEFDFFSVDISVRGFVDMVRLQADGVLIGGWACQKRLTHSIDVKIYGNGPMGSGTFIAQTTANLSNEPAVDQICESTGGKHRYKVLIPKKDAMKFAKMKVYVNGIHSEGKLEDLVLSNSGALGFPNAIPFMLSEVAKDGAELVVPAGTEVQIDRSMSLGLITINGRLVCPASGDFTITSTSIIISGSGAALECGTLKNRFAGNLKLGLKPGYSMMNSERNVMVSNGGTLRLSGQLKNAGWTNILKTAQAGEQEILLAKSVEWSPGDQVAISPTSYNFREAEQLTVESVKNGNIVRFTTPLKYTHWGYLQKFTGRKDWVVDERAKVANLTRNIVIYADGEESSMDSRGGHVMVMRGAYGYIDAVEFFRMGRMGEMARYPFHWHRAGDVRGQYIANSSIHRSFQRCVTVHGTNNAVVQNNVCYDHFAHGFFLEDGDEIGNHFIKNLGMLSKRPPVGRHLLQSDIDASNGDRFPGPATFWVSNPNNEFVGNIAAGSEGTGFWMSFSNGLHCEPSFCRKPDADYPANVFPQRTATLRFDNNTATGAMVGMTWDGVEEGDLTKNPNNPNDRKLVTTHYSPPTPPKLNNLRFYKNRQSAIYVRGNTMYFPQAILADNRVGLFFAYNQVVTDSAIIAKTKNHSDADYAYNSEFTGVRIYDGPFDLRNIDFMEFPSAPIALNDKQITPTPILLIGGANRFTNAVQGLRFYPEPVHRIDFTPMDGNIGWADANNSPSLRDIDGSLAGKANTILVPDQPYNDDSSCVKAGNKGLRCEYQRGLFIFLSIRDNVPWEQTPFTVKRSDGATTRSLADLAKYIWNLKFGVILGDRYDYEVTFAPSWTMPGKFSNGNWWPDSFQMIFQTEAMGQESPLVAFRGLGQNCRIRDWQPMASAAEVKAAHVNAYYDAGSVLYAKFVATLPTSQGGSEFAKVAQAKNAMVQCLR